MWRTGLQVPTELQVSNQRRWTLGDLELSAGAPSLVPSGHSSVLPGPYSRLTRAQCTRRYKQLKKQRLRNKQDILAQGLSRSTSWPQVTW